MEANFSLFNNHKMKKGRSGFKTEQKEKFKLKFPVITDKDLGYIEGKEREMIEMLGFKLGKTNQELLGIIVDL